MRISDWSSDVCSSDLQSSSPSSRTTRLQLLAFELIWRLCYERLQMVSPPTCQTPAQVTCAHCQRSRSEEHTSELQSLMRISYAVFCLKKKTTRFNNHPRVISTYMHPMNTV